MSVGRTDDKRTFLLISIPRLFTKMSASGAILVFMAISVSLKGKAIVNRKVSSAYFPQARLTFSATTQRA